MIYTITLNPSLDYVVCVDSFMPGVLNRTNKEVIYPGGKGINVSLMLQNSLMLSSYSSMDGHLDLTTLQVLHSRKSSVVTSQDMQLLRKVMIS